MTEHESNIKAIQQSAVHQITSGQVVIDLASGVKELVENSVDAHATSIEIKFKNYGLDSVEVIDNGDGIEKDDFEGIGRKHHTSKLRTFENLAMVSTFGFRGEALSSLCALAHVQVVTATQADAPLATKLELDVKGEIKTKSVSPGKKGTSITITDIFHSLPVRRKDLQKNIKREFTKTIGLLQAYAIVCLGVRITVSNTLANGKKSVLFASHANKTLRDNIANIYGHASVEPLMPLDFSFEMEHTRSIMHKLDPDAPTFSKVSVDGYISKPMFGKGRNSHDRQLCYINSRPCVLPQVSKVINEVYKSFNATQAPCFVLNLKLDTTRYDVNVSPDKRTILLHGESTLVELLREHLTIAFEDAGHQIPKNTTAKGPATAGKTQGRLFSSMIAKFSSGAPEPSESEGEESGEEADSFKQDTSMTSLPSSRTAERTEATVVASDEEERTDEELFVTTNSPPSESRPSARTSHRSTSTTLINLDSLPPVEKPKLSDPVEITVASQGEKEYVQLNHAPSRRKSSRTPVAAAPVQKNLEDFGKILKYVSGDKETIVNDEASESEQEEISVNEEVPHDEVAGPEDVSVDQVADASESESEEEFDDKPSISNTAPSQLSQRSQVNYRHRTHNLNLPVKVSCKKIKKGAQAISQRLATERDSGANKPKHLSDITVSNIADDEALVEGLLNLSIHKDDFFKMELVGQFNLGFILVTKLNESTGQKDLFIVDQHASDEIYNFERLQKETVIQNQPLVVPMLLDLTAMDELTLTNNVEIFERNGFKIKIDEEAPPGKKCRLLSVPFSKSTTFDVKDIHELIYLIDSHPGNPNVKVSKVRSMFAMRACRSSIMIGKPLTPKIMDTVVKHLGKLDKPWNCPHGRPTMRHLVNLGQFKAKLDDFY